MSDFRAIMALLFYIPSVLKIFKCVLTLYHTIPTFNDPEEGFGKHCGKRRKCWQPAFSAFPTVFSLLSKREIIILALFNLLSEKAFNLITSKILLFGKELMWFTVFSSTGRRPVSYCHGIVSFLRPSVCPLVRPSVGLSVHP